MAQRNSVHHADCRAGSKADPSLALTSKPLSSSPNAAVAPVWAAPMTDAFRLFVVAMPAITLSESLSVTTRVTDSCVADDRARDRQREYYGSAGSAMASPICLGSNAARQ
jgi:hypothetical protein